MIGDRGTEGSQHPASQGEIAQVEACEQADRDSGEAVGGNRDEPVLGASIGHMAPTLQRRLETSHPIAGGPGKEAMSEFMLQRTEPCQRCLAKESPPEPPIGDEPQKEIRQPFSNSQRSGKRAPPLYRNGREAGRGPERQRPFDDFEQQAEKLMPQTILPFATKFVTSRCDSLLAQQARARLFGLSGHSSLSGPSGAVLSPANKIDQTDPLRLVSPFTPHVPFRQSRSARELLFDIGQVLRGRSHPYCEPLGIIGFGQDPHLGADLCHDPLSRKGNM